MVGAAPAEERGGNPVTMANSDEGFAESPGGPKCSKAVDGDMGGLSKVGAKDAWSRGDHGASSNW